MTTARLSLGRRAEDEAARRLAEEGWRVLERNARVRYAELGIAGELDIVALDGSALVFVEVKAGRLGSRTGPERPVLAVGPRKQLRLRRLARAWLASEGRRPPFSAIRFDAIGIVFDGERVRDYEHLRGAF
jgi:putative endonuclease